MMAVLLIIVGIIALLIVVALVSDKQMNIESSIIIDKPKQQVFDYIRYMKNQEHFNVWMMMDPEMKKEYKGTDGQAGFIYAWDSSKKKNVGAGEQEIKSIKPGEEVDFEIRFTRPMQDVARSNMKVEQVSATQTKVHWGFYSRMKFPMNIMKPMIKKMLGKNLEDGLINLKKVLEK